MSFNKKIVYWLYYQLSSCWLNILYIRFKEEI